MSRPIASSSSSRASAEMAMRQSMERTNQALTNSRPANTTKAYDPKIEEFRAWCDEKFSHEPKEVRYIVYGEKAHFFLDDAVVGREIRSKRKATEDIQQERPVHKIGHATLSQYGAALVNLWRQQTMMKINSNPHPRQSFNGLLEMAMLQEEATRKTKHVDRGIGTIMDGYTTTDQIASIVNFYFSQNNTKNLRNSLAFLLSHYCLLRGESARKAELPDLQVVNLEGEGSVRCPAMVLVMRQGKTNKHGKLEVGACLRNARVEICPFMMLGTYFFARFQMDNEPFPNFGRSENWFNVKVLKHLSDPTEEWPYSSHHKAIENAFVACNITSSKTTHVGRGAAARMADLQGVQESDIRRMGRWNNSSMNGAYLTGLPRGIMRALAGFPSEQGGAFFLPRDTILPSEELQAKIFPQASEWLNKIHNGQAEQTVSAEGFLKLLLTLRISFLQDSVFMQRKMPHHAIWKHAIFRDPMYLEFKRSLEASAEEESSHENTSMQRIIPFIERQLANINDRQQEAYGNLARMIEGLAANVSDISTGRAPLQINIDWPEGSNLPVTSVRAVNRSSSSTESGSSVMALDEQPLVGNSGQEVRSSSATHSPANYRLSRGITTLTDLYREWTEGLGGNYSVEYMNVNHPGWYKDDKTYYMRRRKIIAAIKQYADIEGFSVWDAVRRAETLRARNGKSIDFVSKNVDIMFTLNE